MAARSDSLTSSSSSARDETTAASTPPPMIETENDALLRTTPSAPTRELFKDFTKLTSNVSMYVPPAGSPAPPANHPTTVIFCAWMNASAKHIDYYNRNYRKIYPYSRIIVLRISTIQFVYTTELTRRKEIAPAVTALLSFEAANGVENERIVLHHISNGGAKRAYGVAGLYLEKTGRKLPLMAFLSDCSPGIPMFKRDLYALTLPLRNANIFIKAPLYAAIFISVCVVYVCTHLVPRESVWPELVWRPTRLFNDPEFLTQEAVRGYAYTESDLSIDYKHVEAHAKEAEEKGYTVSRKKIEGGGHALLWRGKGGEQDYWGWIERFFEGGLTRERI